MQKYRINKDFYFLFKEEIQGSIFILEEGLLYLKDGSKGIPMPSDYNYFFEKVEEERIHLMRTTIPEFGSVIALTRQDNEEITWEQLELCEGIINVDPELAKKFLNGDMVEKEKIINWINEYSMPDHANLKVLLRLLGEETKPSITGCNDEPYKSDDGHAFIENEFKKAKDVVVEDGDTTYILRDKPKQCYEFETQLTPEQFQKLAIENNFEYWTIEQMYEKVCDWIKQTGVYYQFFNDDMKINPETNSGEPNKSFKEFINKK